MCGVCSIVSQNILSYALKLCACVLWTHTHTTQTRAQSIRNIWARKMDRMMVATGYPPQVNTDAHSVVNSIYKYIRLTYIKSRTLNRRKRSNCSFSENNMVISRYTRIYFWAIYFFSLSHSICFVKRQWAANKVCLKSRALSNTGRNFLRLPLSVAQQQTKTEQTHTAHIYRRAHSSNSSSSSRAIQTPCNA